MASPSLPASIGTSGSAAPAGHVLWVAEAALGRLRRRIPAGGFIDDGEGFAFFMQDLRELERTVSELTSAAAFGIAAVEGSGSAAIVAAVARARREGLTKLHRGPDGTPRMAAIAVQPLFVPRSITGEEARSLFLGDDTLTTVVYADSERRPVAVLQRERLFRMFSGQYGWAVYASRPVFEAADDSPWTMPSDTSIVEAANAVASRDAERISDDILLVDAAGRTVGLVRLRDLLRALTGLGAQSAGQLNSLTGLPSGARAEMVLAEMLDSGEPLVVSRVDIADFKTFNERAGFTAGDRTIQALGRAVAAVGRGRGLRFVGHLGGDDFVVAWNDADEALVGAIEIGARFLDGIAGIGPLPEGVAGPELTVATLFVRGLEIRDAATLANRLAALKEAIRRRGRAGVHAIAHLETLDAPQWRPLDREYLAATGQLASVMSR